MGRREWEKGMGEGEREWREKGTGEGNGSEREKGNGGGSLEFFDRTRVLGVFKAGRASPVLGRFASEQP